VSYHRTTKGDALLVGGDYSDLVVAYRQRKPETELNDMQIAQLFERVLAAASGCNIPACNCKGRGHS
jgi:hypothetical protein